MITDVDGFSMVIAGWKSHGDVEVTKARYFGGKALSELDQCYVARSGDTYAHGNSIKRAIDDLAFKMADKLDREEVIAEIRSSGQVTRHQYRAITGACQSGVDDFLRQAGVPEDLDAMPLQDVLHITKGAYGGSTFAEAMK